MPGEKGLATEGGTHVPFIVNAPGLVKAGTVVDDMIDFSDVLPTLAEISGATLPDVELDGRSFWAQCLGEAGNPREWIYQYHYPKYKPAAEPHGQGIRNLEIAWAQNKEFKLYADGTMYALEDRYEKMPISTKGASSLEKRNRKQLQAVIDSMPTTSPKLAPSFGASALEK